jgi:Flp pilus assembly protein TadG
MKRRSLRDESGQSMVEFALIVPVLCMILFGIIQFGILYNNYLMLADAARVGARKAAVSRQAANPVALADAAVRSSASNLDQAKLGVFITATAWAPGADVTVETRYPYKISLLGKVVADGTLSSQTTERVE